MRFVTVLIVLTLAAAVYVANSAPEPGPRPVRDQPAPAEAAPATARGSEIDPAVAEVPESFPAELGKRSGSGFTPTEVTDPLEDVVARPLDTGGPDGPEDNPFLRGEGTPAGEPGPPSIGEGGGIDVPLAMPDELVDAGAADTDPAPAATAPDPPVATADDEVVLPEIELPGTSAPQDSGAPDEGADPVPAAGAGPAAVTGIVAGPRGGGIRGVEIIARDRATRAELAKASSDRKGRYEIKGLADGEVLLEVVASSVPLGYAAPVAVESCRSGSEPAGYGSTCVEVVRSRAPGAVDITLPYSSGVEGVVKDGSGKASPGAMVRAVSTLPGFESVRVVVRTDDEGRYFLPLVPGPYELQVLLPGEGGSARRFAVEAKAGEALMLEAIDFSRPAKERGEGQALGEEAATLGPVTLPVAPAMDIAVAEPAGEGPAAALRTSAVPAAPLEDAPEAADPATSIAGPDAPRLPLERPRPRNRVAIGSGSGSLRPLAPRVTTTGGRAAPTRSLDPRDDEGPTVLAGDGPVTLEGRVISTWGEAVDGVWVACLDERGIRVAFGPTDASGRFALEGTPVGETRVQVAPDAPVGSRSLEGFVLRERPRPVTVRSSEGQRTVIVDDIVADVAPVFRVDGRIVVDDATLRAYREELAAQHPSLAELGMDRVRRAYLRGLSLTRKDGLGPGRDRPIEIGPQGQFEWQCNLPAQDAVLVLSARAARPSEAYGGPVGVVITPAGVRTRELEIRYPAPATDEPRASAPEADVEGPETADAGH